MVSLLVNYSEKKGNKIMDHDHHGNRVRTHRKRGKKKDVFPRTCIEQGEIRLPNYFTENFLTRHYFMKIFENFDI